jgi:hypothetical protein
MEGRAARPSPANCGIELPGLLPHSQSTPVKEKLSKDADFYPSYEIDAMNVLASEFTLTSTLYIGLYLIFTKKLLYRVLRRDYV